jgi:branched-chain amino acid transport system permease protein
MELLIGAIIQGILIGGVYAVAAMGLTLVFGVMDIVNFAHGEFIMLGMYVVFWLFTLLGIDPLLSLFINIGIFFLIGYFLQKLIINQIVETAPVLNRLLITLALSVVLTNGALMAWKGDFRSIFVYAQSVVDLGFMDIRIGVTRLMSFIIAVLVAVVFYFLIMKTKWGIAVRATAQNRQSAELMGINIHQMYSITFGMGAALASAAGTSIILFHPVFPTVGLNFVLKTFIIVVLGGMGSFVGAFLGSLIIGVIESLSAVYIASTYKEIVSFIIFILILLFKPSGLFGKRERKT